MSNDRLHWIESWARGWRKALQAKPGDETYYVEMPLDVAVSMIEEMATALRDPRRAISLLAHTLHESGQEIGEMIESVRASRDFETWETSR